MTRYLLPLLVAGQALLLPACDGTQSTTRSIDANAKTLSERVESLLNDVSTAAQDELDRQTERVLAALNERLDSLAERAAESAENASRETIEAMRMELEKKRDEIREKLAALRDDTGGARTELRRELADALNELRELIDTSIKAIEESGSTEGSAPAAVNI